MDLGHGCLQTSLQASRKASGRHHPRRSLPMVKERLQLASGVALRPGELGPCHKAVAVLVLSAEEAFRRLLPVALEPRPELSLGEIAVAIPVHVREGVQLGSPQGLELHFEPERGLRRDRRVVRVQFAVAVAQLRGHQDRALLTHAHARDALVQAHGILVLAQHRLHLMLLVVVGEHGAVGLNEALQHEGGGHAVGRLGLPLAVVRLGDRRHLNLGLLLGERSAEERDGEHAERAWHPHREPGDRGLCTER
mmetsp:Transcript_110979/g.345883  ORF Transcript_110979/g.345883 Transcript_110979/m.345883 type:complete len:251 (-) Transcript_110979:31-783(-)